MCHKRKQYTSDLTDKQWEKIRPLLPIETGGPGRPIEIDMREVSPLLLPVLKGIAEGHAYFTPEASLNLRFSDLTAEDTILLALMAVGMQVCDLVHELDCSTHGVYTAQCQLRKKLSVQTNEQAILAGIRRKLVGVLTEPPNRVFREIA